MAIFRLKNLFLNSLLVLIFSSCVPTFGYRYGIRRIVQPVFKDTIISYYYTVNGCIKTVDYGDVTPIINDSNSLLYRTNISLFNKYYSGLILLKKTDSATSHLVFVTEVGMKMFDIEIKKDSLRMAYCFGPMNKPKITNLLESDMGSILLYPLLNKTAKIYVNTKQENTLYVTKEKGRKYFYYTQPNSPRIAKTLVRGKIFTKQKTVYKYGADNLPESVSLKHKGLLRLKIKLNRIVTQKTND